MSVFGKWMRRFRGGKTRAEISSGFDEEMSFHIEMETEKNMAAGMERSAARRKALMAFGGANELREQVRDELGWAWWGDLFRDLRYGARVLLRRKGFAASVIVTLALCLGACTAFFALFERLVLEELPFEDSEALVEIYRTELANEQQRIGGNLSLRNEYATQSDLFESVSFFRNKWSNIEIGGRGFRGNAVRVSPGFFETLGISAARGEVLSETTADGSVWMAESIWESAFGSDEAVLGQMVLLDGAAYRLAGIAPRAAERAFEGVSVFVKIDRSDMLANPGDESVRAENEGVIWARLKDGVSGEQVARVLMNLENRFQENASSVYRSNNDTNLVSHEVQSVQNVRTQWARPRLLLLNAGALLVLAIGCVNVANLMLAHTNARGEEYWVRRMLGAPVGRLLRQCVVETMLLVVVAWCVGMGVAWGCIRFLGSYSSELFRQNESVGFTLEAALYGAGIAMLCMLVLGTLVGTRALAASQNAENARSSHQLSPGRGSYFIRASLAVWQTGFTLAILICGGLLVKSFYMVSNQDLGFDPNGLVTGRIHLTDARYGEDSRRDAFKGRLLEGLVNQVGVKGVSLSSTIPTFGFPDQAVVKRDAGAGEAVRRTFFSYVSPGHMRTMGITLIEGRDFDDTDEFGWQTPVLVDERFARVLYPDESVLGKRISLGRRPRNENNWAVVVGVVESTKQTALDGDDGMPMLYMPLKGSWVDEFSVFIRAEGDEMTALRLIEEEVARLDTGMPVYRSGTLDAVMADSLAGRRGLLWLCLGLGAVALVLSAVGVYGASAFRVSQRLREFAIRMAIGATERRVVAEHVRADLRLAVVGLGFGVMFALQASRFLSVWLYGVERFDWLTYAGIAAAVLLVYSISSYVPSWLGVKRNRVRL